MKEKYMARRITYLTACRTKFNVPEKIWHASIHIVVDGKTEVWEYGRFDGTNGKLKQRKTGKHKT